jgi:hypothetical protein
MITLQHHHSPELGLVYHVDQAFQLHVFHTVIRCEEYRMSPN